MDTKRKAAEKAVENIENGMCIGLGTGSTSYWAIQKIGERVKEGLQITAVASSIQSEEIAKRLNIPIIPFAEVTEINLYIDGADEVDKNRNLIKGGGGALLREKILAYNSKRFLVIVDQSKLVDDLGTFPLPLEVLPFAVELTLKKLKALGGNPQLRQKEGKNYSTDNGNLIADCNFYPITDPEKLNNQLKAIPGVVETGLFLHPMVNTVFVGYEDGTVKEI